MQEEQKEAKEEFKEEAEEEKNKEIDTIEHEKKTAKELDKMIEKEDLQVWNDIGPTLIEFTEKILEE